MTSEYEIKTNYCYSYWIGARSSSSSSSFQLAFTWEKNEIGWHKHTQECGAARQQCAQQNNIYVQNGFQWRKKKTLLISKKKHLCAFNCPDTDCKSFYSNGLQHPAGWARAHVFVKPLWFCGFSAKSMLREKSMSTTNSVVWLKPSSTQSAPSCPAHVSTDVGRNLGPWKVSLGGNYGVIASTKKKKKKKVRLQTC